ncbi:MAG: hypothetical protein LBC68_00040 [Prevotellaceae bacterium]|jgi:hypothetical protein|nr:hypothetical protein [Prevotellaceae bacterium]
MKNLLEHNFISHYGLTASVAVNVVSRTNANFDLKDDDVMVYPSGKGIAKYSNPNCKEVNVINYETFFKGLQQSFQQNKENCDLLVYTSDRQYFLLNELTNTNKQKGKKYKKSVSQMLQTLQIISDVPEISQFIQLYSTRQCCFFNKKAQAPKHIKATDAFSRLATLSENGYKMSNPDIETFDFELWEFSGNQTFFLAKL